MYQATSEKKSRLYDHTADNDHGYIFFFYVHK